MATTLAPVILLFSGLNLEKSVAENIRVNNFENLSGKPNIIIFIADDMGYSDLASYGNPSIKKNYLDDLAASGIRYQSAYAADSLCSPSRAGLLTGRLPIRTGIVGDDGSTRVFVPIDTGGLSPEETTIPKVLKTVGYRTGMVGKWHLGINKETPVDGTYLPRNHGFDFVGLNLPMTNNAGCDESKYWRPDGPLASSCLLYNDTQIVQQPINFTGLTNRLLSDFDRFMDSNEHGKPFFFYFSFPQVHDALFSWKSGNNWPKTGMYSGDLLEMAEAIETAMNKIEKMGLKDDTLVMFLSDHGPHKELCSEGGSSILKGGKATSFEGGFRIPLFMSWPRVIKPGQISNSVISMLDFLPTLAAMTGAKLPENVILDGYDLRAEFFNSTLSHFKRPIFYYCNQILMAVRLGRFKFHFRTVPLPTEEQMYLQCPNGLPLHDYYYGHVLACTHNSTFVQDPPLVFDVLQDPGEKWPISYQRVSESGRAAVTQLVKDMQISLKKDRRPPQLNTRDHKVQPCCNPPECHCDYNGRYVKVGEGPDFSDQEIVFAID